MKPVMILSFLIALSYSAKSQCTCEEKFKFLKHELETNYAGYRDKVNDKNRKDYEKHTAAYRGKFKKTSNNLYCYALLREWLEFFRDGHVQLSDNTPEVAETDTATINRLISQAEVINLSDKDIEALKNKKSSDLEGIYILRQDTMYTVALIASKNEFRDYAAVIIDSKTPFWKKGQVKFEMRKPDTGSVYYTILYNRYHEGNIAWYATGDMWLDGQVWIKPGYQMPDLKGSNVPRFDYKLAQAKKLSDSTLYIQIGTFRESNAERIDSLFAAYEKELKTMPNLVLDLRYNGGGSDGSYGPIVPYLYTHPVLSDGNQVLATTDNIRRRAAFLSEEWATAEDSSWVEELTGLMKKNLGKFVEQAATDTIKLDKTEPYPGKVAILINGNCASTTEQLLLFAKESKKVTLMGEHTYGELDYSNVLRAESPCKEIGFGYSSTRSYRVDKGTGIDNIGIQPDIVLKDDQDWIEEARKYLEKK